MTSGRRAPVRTGGRARPGRTRTITQNPDARPLNEEKDMGTRKHGRLVAGLSVLPLVLAAARGQYEREYREAGDEPAVLACTHVLLLIEWSCIGVLRDRSGSAGSCSATGSHRSSSPGRHPAGGSSGGCRGAGPVLPPGSSGQVSRTGAISSVRPASIRPSSASTPSRPSSAPGACIVVSGGLLIWPTPGEVTMDSTEKSSGIRSPRLWSSTVAPKVA